MPTTHEFSRTAAALGTTLALLLLPLTVAIEPAAALTAPISPAASEGLLSTEAVAESDADSTSSDDGEPSPVPTDDSSGDASTDPDPVEGPDSGRCATEPAPGEPCEQADPDGLKAIWNATDKTLTLPDDQNDPTNDMPSSWVGQVFEGPSQNEAWSSPAAEASGLVDDSGNPVPSQADTAPTYSLNEAGQVIDSETSAPVVFSGFTEDPDWVFTSDGQTISVAGQHYEGGGNDTADSTSSTDGTTTDSGSSTASGDSSDTTGNQDDTITNAANANTTADDTDSGSSDPDATDDTSGASTDTGTDGSTSSTDSSADAADSSSTADAASSADSASATSDSTSDTGSSDSTGQQKSQADVDGADTGGDQPGDASGDGDRNTPDPATGNGSADGREEIPGNVGNDWLPGGNGGTPPPDYSDPVPSSPDESAPTDDTDLITGGNQPSPRGNNQASTSFGESFISTLVNSWPVFVLAAFGMAAVGFILFIVGRRRKQSSE